MDNINSRMSLVCVQQATVCKCTLPAKLCPDVLLKQLTLVVAGAIASRVSGLSVVTSKSRDTKKKKL